MVSLSLTLKSHYCKVAFKTLRFYAVGCSWAVCSGFWGKYSQLSACCLRLYIVYISVTTLTFFCLHRLKTSLLLASAKCQPCISKLSPGTTLSAVVRLLSSHLWPLPWWLCWRPVTPQGFGFIKGWRPVWFLCSSVWNLRPGLHVNPLLDSEFI